MKRRRANCHRSCIVDSTQTQFYKMSDRIIIQSKLLFLLIVLFPCTLMAQDKNVFRRHYLILYDNSYPFYSREERNPRILKTMQALFTNQIPRGVDGRINNLVYEREKKVPFFEPAQDEISFYYFGLNRYHADYLLGYRDRLKRNKKLYTEFKERFINSQDLNWSKVREKYKNNAAEYIKSLWRHKKPEWANGYTFSNIVYPVALERINSEHFADEYILIIVSDFLTGADFGNRQDYGLVHQIFGYNDYYSGEK